MNMLLPKELSKTIKVYTTNITVDASCVVEHNSRMCRRRISCTKTWVRSGQYFNIFMVTLVAASSFILFHAARSLELLRMMLPRTRAGNFGVKKFRCPTASKKFF